MKRLTIEKFISKATLIHGSKFDYSKIKYINNSTKIKIICPIHNIFDQTPSDHLSGYGCPGCGGTLKLNTTTFLEKLKMIRDDYNNHDYSLVNYINTKTKIKIICKIHGIFEQIPAKHLMGQGCPKCRYIKFSKSKTSNTCEFIKKSTKKHGNTYDYSISNYINNTTKICIKCKIHNKFWIRPNDHLHGQGCPKCIHRISNPEILFLDYLHIPKTNRQIYINPYQVDALYNNIVYEFLGDYWHGNPFKFPLTDIHPIIKKTYGQLYEETMNKFKKLKLLGYNVKYIWEMDWKRFKKQIDKTPKIIDYKI